MNTPKSNAMLNEIWQKRVADSAQSLSQSTYGCAARYFLLSPDDTLQQATATYIRDQLIHYKEKHPDSRHDVDRLGIAWLLTALAQGNRYAGQSLAAIAVHWQDREEYLLAQLFQNKVGKADYGDYGDWRHIALVDDTAQNTIRRQAQKAMSLSLACMLLLMNDADPAALDYVQQYIRTINDWPQWLQLKQAKNPALMRLVALMKSLRASKKTGARATLEKLVRSLPPSSGLLIECGWNQIASYRDEQADHLVLACIADVKQHVEHRAAALKALPQLQNKSLLSHIAPLILSWSPQDHLFATAITAARAWKHDPRGGRGCDPLLLALCHQYMTDNPAACTDGQLAILDLLSGADQKKAVDLFCLHARRRI